MLHSVVWKTSTPRRGLPLLHRQDENRNSPAAYAEARAGIDSVDAFVRSLDDVRSKAGVSKALLAKRTGTQPAPCADCSPWMPQTDGWPRS